MRGVEASSAAMGWEVVGDEIALSQGSEDEEVAELTAIGEDGARRSGSTWWGDLLRKHADNLGMTVPFFEGPPVTVLSGCTGSFSEGAVLEETSDE